MIQLLYNGYVRRTNNIWEIQVKRNLQ